MNAIQPSRNPLPPERTRRRVARSSRHHRRYAYQAIVAETTAKLVVNIVLSTAALAALVQLLPYQLSQQPKLQEIRAEVEQTEKRVNRLSSDFSRGFDPQQAQSVMQEQSQRVDPSQRQIVWLDQKTPAQKSAPSSR